MYLSFVDCSSCGMCFVDGRLIESYSIGSIRKITFDVNFSVLMRKNRLLFHTSSNDFIKPLKPCSLMLVAYFCSFHSVSFTISFLLRKEIVQDTYVNDIESILCRFCWKLGILLYNYSWVSSAYNNTFLSLKTRFWVWNISM